MGRPARIAICEPHPELGVLLLRLVEHLGYATVACGDPAEPDAVLLNPGSERMLERARELRHRNPRLPIVCVSSVAPDGRALEVEPVATLEKPFRVDELRRALESALAPATAAA